MSLLRRAVALEDQIQLDRLLDDAFAPARLRTATISAARVRARVAWQPVPAVGRGWRAVSLLGRLGETTLGFGMTAILFAASLGSLGGPNAAAVRPEHAGEPVAAVSLAFDDTRFLRLLRLGHPVPARAVPVRDDRDLTIDLRPADDAEPVISVRERRALAR